MLLSNMFIGMSNENSEDEYEVEAVLNRAKLWSKKHKKRCIHYFIKWKNYDNQHNEWIPASEMDVSYFFVLFDF